MKRLPLLFLPVACLLAPIPAISQTGDPSCASADWDEFFGCVVERVESMPYPHHCVARLDESGFIGLAYIARCATRLPEMLDPALDAQECDDASGREWYEACVRDHIEDELICVMFSVADQLRATCVGQPRTVAAATGPPPARGRDAHA